MFGAITFLIIDITLVTVNIRRAMRIFVPNLANKSIRGLEALFIDKDDL